MSPFASDPRRPGGCPDFRPSAAWEGGPPSPPSAGAGSLPGGRADPGEQCLCRPAPTHGGGPGRRLGPRRDRLSLGGKPRLPRAPPRRRGGGPSPGGLPGRRPRPRGPGRVGPAPGRLPCHAWQRRVWPGAGSRCGSPREFLPHPRRNSHTARFIPGVVNLRTSPTNYLFSIGWPRGGIPDGWNPRWYEACLSLRWQDESVSRGSHWRPCTSFFVPTILRCGRLSSSPSRSVPTA